MKNRYENTTNNQSSYSIITIFETFFKSFIVSALGAKKMPPDALGRGAFFDLFFTISMTRGPARN